MLIFIFLIFGFILLVKGADLLVDGSSSLAKRIRVSDLIIGLTIVAFGTSAPELIVSLIAAIKGNTDISVANVLGSNIFNILVILGLSALIMPLIVKKATVWKEIPLCILASVIVFVLGNDIFNKENISVLSSIDGIVLLLFFLLFTAYVVHSTRKEQDNVSKPILSLKKSLVYIVIGLGGLIIGGKFVVDAAVDIAGAWHISENLIGLTIVAGGTSLPELMTSIVAVWKKNADIAVGNIIGSNIFNIFLILGISSLITPLPFSGNNLSAGIGIAASLLLFNFMFTGEKHRLDRWEGAIFILIYLLYLGYIILF